MSGIRGLAVNPGAAGAAVGIGGAALSVGAATALSNASDEELDMLSNAGGGDDTAMAAAILRQARDKAKAPAPAPRVPDARDAEAGMSRGRPAEPVGIATLQKPPAPRGGVGPAAGAAAPPAPAPAAVTPQTYEEYMAQIRAGSAPENEEYAKITAAAKARDATRRAELEAQGGSRAGLLGIEMSEDTRKGLSAAGDALLRSKSKYLDLGEGIAAGFDARDKAGVDRKAKMALLDDAEEKRQLAAVADRRGNTAAAALYRKQYEELQDKAAALSGAAETRKEMGRHNLAAEKNDAARTAQMGEMARTRASGIAGLTGQPLKVLHQQAADVKAQLAAHEKVATMMADQQEAAAIRKELQDRQRAIDAAIAKLPGAATIGAPGASSGGFKVIGSRPN